MDQERGVVWAMVAVCVLSVVACSGDEGGSHPSPSLALATDKPAVPGPPGPADNVASGVGQVPNQSAEVGPVMPDREAPDPSGGEGPFTAGLDGSNAREPNQPLPSGAPSAAAIDGGMGAEIDTPSDAEEDAAAFADCMATMRASPGEASTPYPGGRWSVPDVTYGSQVITGVEIEMSDGVVLVGDISYPTEIATGQRAAGPFPVILTQNPYGSALFGPQYGEIFVTHGYIFATVDVRGTSRSGGGVHDLFSPREADDGAELVAWAASLDGSDGRVGLQGCSQLGINQLETATRLGPDSPVKAMIPACPSGDFYRDTVFDNGVPSLTAGFLVPDSSMGDDTAYYREYWQTRDRVARAPAIARADIPTLLWSGWHEPGALGSLDLYTVLQNVSADRSEHAPVAKGDRVTGKYQVIIGDWGHGAGLDLGIELQWYDTWIKGIDTGLPTDTDTPLHLMELGGTGRWINARCYPLVERYTPLYLEADGELSASASDTEAERELTWVPQGVAAEAVEYRSTPFDSGAMLAGPLAVQLQVTSSNTNLQLFVELLDEAPDGSQASINFGSIIGALRKTDPEKSWTDDGGLPTRPFLALDEDQPMTPGERTKLVVPLGPTVWSLEPGHRLALRIASHPPSNRCLGVIVPPVGCYPTRPMLETLRGGTYRFHLGGELGSLVSLPLLDYGALSTVDNVTASPTGNSRTPLPVDW